MIDPLLRAQGIIYFSTYCLQKKESDRSLKGVLDAESCRKQNKIKLSCQNIWKIYGDDPNQFFNKIGLVDDANGLAHDILASNHILANANVSFDVYAGEIFVIMGLSGSGKSTIVRCLSRLVEPTAGTILLDDENLLAKSQEELTEVRRHKMGMVFQSFGLMPHLNVIDNVAFPLKLQGIKEESRYAQAERVIELVGLQGRETNFPNELSGGQQQRGDSTVARC